MSGNIVTGLSILSIVIKDMRTNLMLLAGNGQRFADANYDKPKPLIEVDGIPMFVASAQSLPPADKIVFVVSKKHIDQYKISEIIYQYFPQAEIIIQTDALQGQAHSALVAEKTIDPESILTIASCDARPIYDVEKFEQEIKNPLIDALVWSFSNYPAMATQPKSYGWIINDSVGNISSIKYKTPISENPIKDNAVVGWFSFKKADICFSSIKEIITRGIKTGTEYSLDECINILVENKIKVKVFEIQRFISWGTPNELRTYEYWKKYFSKK